MSLSKLIPQKILGINNSSFGSSFHLLPNRLLLYASGSYITLADLDHAAPDRFMTSSSTAPISGLALSQDKTTLAVIRKDAQQSVYIYDVAALKLKQKISLLEIGSTSEQV